MANDGNRSKRSARDGRLAQALRDNLRRRKAQARSRAESHEADPAANGAEPGGSAERTR